MDEQKKEPRDYSIENELLIQHLDEIYPDDIQKSRDFVAKLKREDPSIKILYGPNEWV